MILEYYFGPVDTDKYNYITLPIKDSWGILARKDSPLAKKEKITYTDICDKPLIVSRQLNYNSDFSNWMKKDFSKLNIVSTYNLIYNASLLVDEGIGYALTLDKLINTTGNSNLCFIPLSPQMEIDIRIVWKKYQIFSKPAEKFLEYLKENL